MIDVDVDSDGGGDLSGTDKVDVVGAHYARPKMNHFQNGSVSLAIATKIFLVQMESPHRGKPYGALQYRLVACTTGPFRLSITTTTMTREKKTTQNFLVSFICMVFVNKLI